MGYKVDNAVIMAAGTASRFAPLSAERHKALAVVRGEVLIERQIRQLREARIGEIILVTGYRKEQFAYLQEKYGVILIENDDYLARNNNGSIYAARKYLKNTYICSSDNYFAENPFQAEEDDACYAAVYAEGETKEWCMTEDKEGYIDSVTVGGRDAWFMLGHVFWTEEFSRKFLEILDRIYDLPETAGKLWESIYMEHLNELKMRMKRFPDGVIYEFDTLDELREFDASYVDDTRSVILKDIAKKLGCRERDITGVTACKSVDNAADGFRFHVNGENYQFIYETRSLRRDDQ